MGGGVALRYALLSDAPAVDGYRGYSYLADDTQGVLFYINPLCKSSGPPLKQRGQKWQTFTPPYGLILLRP